MSAIVERLISSRDRLRGFAVPSDDDIIDARQVMADAANALTSQTVNYTNALHALDLARPFVADAQEAQPNDEAAGVLAAVDHALILGADR